MAVDETSLERIRKATFPASRRGYDKREVDKFLNRLADWLETGGGDQARSDTVRRELERVGERTGAILSEAEDSAQTIRAEAEQEAEQLRTDTAAEAEQARSEADAYSTEARAAADTYSKETREAADQNAAETKEQADQDAADAIAAAEAKSARIIEEGMQRRQDIEAVISDLASRRDQAIGDLETLGGKLSDAITDHKPSEADPFSIPEELDPVERAGGNGAIAESELDPAVEDEADLLDEEDFEVDGEAVEEDSTAVFDAEEDVPEADDDDGTPKRRSRRSRASSKSKR